MGSVEECLDYIADYLASAIAERVAERLPPPQPPQSPPPPAEFVTTMQASKALALGESTLALWRARGKGPKFVKIGTAVRYSRADLDEWLAAQPGKRK